MEITVSTVGGSKKQVEVIKAFYYTVAGKRVKFCIHDSLDSPLYYTITHVKSALRVRDYPKHKHGLSARNSADIAKRMLKEVIDRVGEEKVRTELIKAGEIFK